MALVLADRIKETSTTTGTGAYTLAGAVTSFDSFSVVGDTNTTYYCAVDNATGDWEIGVGTYTAVGTTLARTTILQSTNADAAVSWAAGTREVFVVYPADKAVYRDASDDVSLETSDLYIEKLIIDNNTLTTDDQFYIDASGGSSKPRITWDANDRLTYDRSLNEFQFAIGANAKFYVNAATITAYPTASFDLSTGDLRIWEGSDHDATPEAGWGQFWVKDDAPNIPMFTDDAGTDHKLVGGKQTIWVPAGAMRPTASNPCGDLTDTETTAGRPDLTHLPFAGTTADEFAQFQVKFPKAWDLGTVSYKVYWASTAADTDTCRWQLEGVACGDGDTIDVAYGTLVAIDDAAQSTTEDLYVSAESSALTIAGTPAADQLCFFRIGRDQDHANDTMVEDAQLIGIELFWTASTNSDD
jgi:hypothetical protein